MVQCDACDEWYHYTCVDVNDSIADKCFSCSKCLQKGSDNQSRSSKNSKRSAKSRQLALQKLEEERNLQKERDQEYLNKKYALLDEENDSGDGDEIEIGVQGTSCDKSTALWVSNLGKQSIAQATEISKPDIPNNVTSHCVQMSNNLHTTCTNPTSTIINVTSCNQLSSSMESNRNIQALTSQCTSTFSSPYVSSFSANIPTFPTPYVSSFSANVVHRFQQQ